MKQTSIKVYIYADLLNSRLSISDFNFWYGEKERATGIYQTSTCSFQLLGNREISLLDYQNFDFTLGKIQALENQLGNLHVQAENIKAQIQELLSIGYETVEGTKEKDLPDTFHFDDDEPF